MIFCGCLIYIHFLIPALSCHEGWWGDGCKRRCRCLHSTRCDHVNGSCASGCQAGYRGPTCELVCPPGQHGPNCSLNCGHCKGGQCNPVTGCCPSGCALHWSARLSQTCCPEGETGPDSRQTSINDTYNFCTAQYGDVNKSTVNKYDYETRFFPSLRSKQASAYWKWILTTVSVVFSCVVCISFRFFCWRSVRSRKRRVKNMFNKLTSDSSFRFINIPILKRRKSSDSPPQFDVKYLSRKDKNEILKELDRQLGDDESYNDFVQSMRYKELRLLIANKIWSTNNDLLSTLQGERPSNAFLRDCIHRWKLNIKLPMDSEVDRRLSEDKPRPSCSILRETTSTRDDPCTQRNDHTVRFSDAASMVIFPISASPSLADSTSYFDPVSADDFYQTTLASSPYEGDDKEKPHTHLDNESHLPESVLSNSDEVNAVPGDAEKLDSDSKNDYIF